MAGQGRRLSSRRFFLTFTIPDAVLATTQPTKDSAHTCNAAKNQSTIGLET